MARIAADPVEAASRLADTLAVYWELALAEHWPRLRGLLEADVLWRSRRIAVGGAAWLFEDIHESVSWEGDRLRVADPWRHTGPLSGEGLLLVPSAFTWPRIRKLIEPYQATLTYPVRGVGTLWEASVPPASDALRTLIGHTRAQILVLLDLSDSTTGLARKLDVTPSAVSQHLTILRANGLVTAARVGSAVLYQRTSRGDHLIGST